MTKLDFDPELPLNKIDISISNARKTNLEEGLKELADSIREIGVQQPVTVFKKPDDRFELIIGQRRYLASKKIGLKTIPAIITTVSNETDILIRSFIENIHRLDLEYEDKMTVATELLKKLKTVNKVAEALGVDRQTVKKYLGYSAVPEPIKKMVAERKLSASTALRVTENISNEKQAIEIAGKIREIPRGEDRTEIIDVAKENPDKDLKEIEAIAKKRKPRKITIDFSERIYDALSQASRKYNSDKKIIILEATEDWLKNRGFIK